MIEPICHAALQSAGNLVADVFQTLLEGIVTPTGPDPQAKSTKTKSRTIKAAKGTKT